MYLSTEPTLGEWDMGNFTIGRLARAAKVGVETIRYYERCGLIVQPSKPDCGYRQYPQTTLERIVFIRNNQSLGFTLNEIRAILDLMDGQEMDCATASGMIDQKLSAVGQKIAALKRLEHLLKKLANRIGSCGNKGEMKCLSEFLTMEE